MGKKKMYQSHHFGGEKKKKEGREKLSSLKKLRQPQEDVQYSVLPHLESLYC